MWTAHAQRNFTLCLQKTHCQSKMNQRNQSRWKFRKIFWKTTSRHLLEARAEWRDRGRAGGGNCHPGAGLVGGGWEGEAGKVGEGEKVEKDLVLDVNDRDSPVVGWWRVSEF